MLVAFLKKIFNQSNQSNLDWHLRFRCVECWYHVEAHSDNNTSILEFAGFQKKWNKWENINPNKNICRGCGRKIITDVELEYQSESIVTTWRQSYEKVSARCISLEDNKWEFKEL